ncbi:MAG: hypothetical protein Kow0080_10920 [Candidatus Promineifilaceae bacterium]
MRETAAPPVVAQSAVDPRFGAIESFWAAPEAAELGVGWERILFYWNSIQPGGPGDWNTLHVPEEWLAEARAQGRQVVGLLKNTPNWATDGEFASGVPRGLYLPVDDPGNLWANYVRQVVTYYGPRGVRHWIIWNEPDIAPDVYGHEFSGSVEDYYQLVKVAYTVIKSVDPGMTVLLGGMTYWHDPSYLRRYLQVVVADPEAAANNYFFDAVSVHIYFRPETMGTIIGNAFAVQQQLGIVPLKPVWVNETNARPSMDPEWPVSVQAFEIDLEQQAWYIPQAFALGFYAGAARMSVYKLVDINLSPGDESWGLLRPYDHTKRPAFFAYQTTIKYLSGFTYPIYRQQTDLYTMVTFNRPTGVTRVLWARTTMPVTVQVPALAESGLQISVLGSETPIVPENGVYQIGLGGARCYDGCYLGGEPVFIFEADVQAAGNETAFGSGAGGGVVPTAVPTLAPADSPTAAPTIVPTSTPTVTATVTAVPTATPTPTVTNTPTATATATVTVTPTAAFVPTHTPTHVPTVTAVPETPASNPSASPAWLVMGGIGLFLLLLLFWFGGTARTGSKD